MGVKGGGGVLGYRVQVAFRVGHLLLSLSARMQQKDP